MREMPDVPHSLQDQLMAKVERLLQERRQQNIPVATERRGRNPQRRGYEEWRDVETAFEADATHAHKRGFE